MTVEHANTKRVGGLAVVTDRFMAVPAGCRVVTDYVSVWNIRLECRDRMAVGDVAASYNRLLQLAPRQEHPAPFGYWQDGRFILVDGRHAYVALLMLGVEQILVAWVE